MLSIREARLEDAEDIGRIQIASWQSAYKTIVPEQHLKHMDLDAHTQRWADNLTDGQVGKVTLMAEVNDNPIGFLTYGPARDENAGFDAELWAIYLHPDFYGQGYGRPFFDEAVKQVKAAGHKNMYVWALKGNTIGRRFYEKMGGVEIKGLIKTVTIAEDTLEEVAYGWVKL